MIRGLLRAGFGAGLVRAGLAAGLALAAAPGRADAEIAVAASILPVHSLVSMVTEGVTSPALIVRPGASPHAFALKPSEALALDRAEVVVWVGPLLEPWMAKPLASLAADARVVELDAVPGGVRLPTRDSEDWSEGHEGHEQAAHEQDEDHHDHGPIDPHLWLDPANARLWLPAIADALAEADPAHAARYQANADEAIARLEGLSEELRTLLAPYRGRPYVVFHDAYHYFEARFGLEPVGAISLGDADQPSVRRIREIRKRIAEEKVVCVFAEPQFEPRLVDTVIEGSGARKGVLDPIGAGLEPGPELYPALLRAMAQALTDCLG
jgi:zinc transport system substrate-binding protein